ncbi:hypothetical protein H6F96_19530 [Microcoleus sp. FACHB-53]|nr:hypothetical protein [Microcoleus sp. FACHB-53]
MLISLLKFVFTRNFPKYVYRVLTPAVPLRVLLLLSRNIDESKSAAHRSFAVGKVVWGQRTQTNQRVIEVITRFGRSPLSIFLVILSSRIRRLSIIRTETGLGNILVGSGLQ